MIHYLWWVPSVFIYYIIYSWLSKQNNIIGGHYIWLTFVVGALCPFWIIVSRISKNLLFDGMLYDITFFLAFIITMLFLGEGIHFALHNWIGLALIITGFILMRWGI